MTVKQRFKSSIKRGTGEAYLLMIQYPNLDFSADIIRASLKNLSYDNQCEERSEYVYDSEEETRELAKKLCK